LKLTKKRAIIVLESRNTVVAGQPAERRRRANELTTVLDQEV
jgi:hypothetical protein